MPAVLVTEIEFTEIPRGYQWGTKEKYLKPRSPGEKPTTSFRAAGFCVVEGSLAILLQGLTGCKAWSGPELESRVGKPEAEKHVGKLFAEQPFGYAQDDGH